MAPRTRKTAAKAAEAASEPAEKPVKASKPEPKPEPAPRVRLFGYEQRIWRRIDDPALPGQGTAAVLAAINAGERPVGPAVAEDITDCGDSVVVGWHVPVEGA